MPRAIVTDIEGTTSSITFVKDVLFPYAAQHMLAFRQEHWQDTAVREQIAALEQDVGKTLATPEAANEVLQQWIVEDRKATPLKALQGMIWKAGYESGAYTAHLYPEVADCLRRWHAQGLPLYVYSSGSIAAQKLFFGFSDAGDLTPLFSGYFDTTSGGKREVQSYRNIAAAIGEPAEELLFLSDIVEELDAAHDAGFQTILLDREQSAPACDHRRVTDFRQISF